MKEPSHPESKRSFLSMKNVVKNRRLMTRRHRNDRRRESVLQIVAGQDAAKGFLTLEDAIHRMTQLSCERFGLANRGLVREGYFADLVLFDPATIRDRATYEDPKQEPEGIAMVVVNGLVAYEEGRHTGAGAGRALRRGQ